MTVHTHWDPVAHRFVQHDHIHSRAHDHEVVQTSMGPRSVVVPGPGNYSPHGARSEASGRDGSAS